MKIKIGDLILDNIFLSKTDDVLIIETDDKVNPFDVAILLSEQKTIECIYDDEAVEVFEGEFSLNHFEQYGGTVKYCISFPSPLEKAQKKIKELTEALLSISATRSSIIASAGPTLKPLIT